MSHFTIRVEDARARAALDQLQAAVQVQAQTACLLAAGAQLERETKTELGAHGKTPSAMVTLTRGPRKGERAKRWLGPSPGGPGGSPGIFTGATRASVGHSRVTRGMAGLQVSVGPTTIYSRALDRLHPFMEPTWNRANSRVYDAYMTRLRRFLP